MPQTSKNNQKRKVLKKRRYPRRRFVAKVGCLFRGHYMVTESVQIGEGGMMINAIKNESGAYVGIVGDQLVISFQVPGRIFISVRGQIQYISEHPQTKDKLWGMQFMNISFDQRRQLRDFISAKTEEEARAEGVFY